VNYDSLSGFFIFENKGLFGYGELMDEAKYLRLEPYKYQYSKFELPNGKKGWLNKRGKEILERNYD